MRIVAGMRFARRLVKAAVGRDVSHRVELKLPSTRFGSDLGGWVVYTPILSPKSIVYSFGVGEDVSFDLELISALALTVCGFDPTPKSIRWINEQKLPASYRFYPWGIADYDGTATFKAPLDPSFVSYTLLHAEGEKCGAVQAEVRRLESIMKELGHDSVDVLKLDVEGAEYAVLDDILASGLDVRQILVEFHHRFDSIPPRRTNRAVDRLRRSGYRLFSVSPRGEEYSFVRSDMVLSNDIRRPHRNLFII